MSNVIAGNNLIAVATGGALYTTTLARTVEGSQKLLTTPAAIIAAYIIDELGKMTSPSDELDWPLYISHLPEGDDVDSDCGAIYDTAGINDPRQMNGLVPQHPGIQLRIRSNSYVTGYAKIEDIASALDEVVNATLVIDSEEYEIQNVSRTSPIVPLGIETKRRFSFTVNFIITVKVLS